jgi:uncharacterized protein
LKPVFYNIKTNQLKMGKFVISKRKNGEFQFQTILTSEGYSTRTACDNGIDSVRKNSLVETRFEKKASTNGKFYFNLKATNGQIIGTSEMYEAVAGRNNGVASVRKNAPDATVTDTTTGK